MFTSVTSATVTSNVAIIAVRIGTPSSVPFTSASRLLCGGSSITSFASGRSAGSNGTISAAIASPAGVLMIEAIRMLPSAFGTNGARNEA